MQVHNPVTKASSIPLSIILQVQFIFTDFTAQLILARACFPCSQKSCYFLNDFIEISMDHLEFCHISAILDCPPVYLVGIAFTCQEQGSEQQWLKQMEDHYFSLVCYNVGHRNSHCVLLAPHTFSMLQSPLSFCLCFSST